MAHGVLINIIDLQAPTWDPWGPHRVPTTEFGSVIASLWCFIG